MKTRTVYLSIYPGSDTCFVYDRELDHAHAPPHLISGEDYAKLPRFDISTPADLAIRNASEPHGWIKYKVQWSKTHEFFTPVKED